MRRVLATVLALAAASSVAGCGKRSIDADQTHSVRITGTSWYRMCDGRNAIFWVKGIGGDSDDIEMVIYDHWACVPAGEETNSNNGPEADPDGIIEDEDD